MMSQRAVGIISIQNKDKSDVQRTSGIILLVLLSVSYYNGRSTHL